jgi:hypothetical protein
MAPEQAKIAKGRRNRIWKPAVLTYLGQQREGTNNAGVLNSNRHMGLMEK